MDEEIIIPLVLIIGGIIVLILNNKFVKAYNKILESFFIDISDDVLKVIMPDYTLKELKDIIIKNFIDIKSAWTEFDYDTLKRLCTKELYEKFLPQLEVIKNDNCKNIKSDFDIRRCSIHDINIIDNQYVLEVALEVQHYDYEINIKTKRVKYGSKSKKVNYRYRLWFVKDIDNVNGDFILSEERKGLS